MYTNLREQKETKDRYSAQAKSDQNRKIGYKGGNNSSQNQRNKCEYNAQRHFEIRSTQRLQSPSGSLIYTYAILYFVNPIGIKTTFTSAYIPNPKKKNPTFSQASRK